MRSCTSSGPKPLDYIIFFNAKKFLNTSFYPFSRLLQGIEFHKMSASLLSPSLFEDSDSDSDLFDLSTQPTTSTALEINQILYNLPSVSY
jgi:hypothetical protein